MLMILFQLNEYSFDFVQRLFFAEDYKMVQWFK